MEMECSGLGRVRGGRCFSIESWNITLKMRYQSGESEGFDDDGAARPLRRGFSVEEIAIRV